MKGNTTMRKGILALSAAAALLVAGCGSSKPKLHIFTWADYIDPELVERFEKENGCRVVIDIRIDASVGRYPAD